MLRQMRVHAFLNAQTCSLRCELVSSTFIVQAISCKSDRNKNQTPSELAPCASSVVADFSARFSTHLKSDAMISAGRIPGC